MGLPRADRVQCTPILRAVNSESREDLQRYRQAILSAVPWIGYNIHRNLCRDSLILCVTSKRAPRLHTHPTTGLCSPPERVCSLWF